jgi:hypothetical protein
MVVTSFSPFRVPGILHFLQQYLLEKRKTSTKSLCQSVFWDKIPEIINFSGGRVHFGSWLQRYQSVVGWPIAFGLCQLSASWWEHVERKMLMWQLRSNRERERGGSMVPGYPSRAHPQWCQLVQLGPTSSTFYHLPVVHGLGTRLWMHGPSGIFQIQTILMVFRPH